MLDPRLLRTQLREIAEILAKRKFTLDVNRIDDLEKHRKEIQIQVQHLQQERNQKSKDIGLLKKQGQSTSTLENEVSIINNQLKQLEEELEHVLHEWTQCCLEIPNILHSSVPFGNSEDDNLEVRKWGEISSDFNMNYAEHFIVAGSYLMDFDTSSKLTGSRFVVLRGVLARLHRALIQFMLDTHTQEHGYTEMYVPYIVNTDTLTGSGHLPKFEKDLFKIAGTQGYYLIPTAEVPVTSTVADTIINEDKLPLKMVSHTPCFRSEAGSYGKDTHGMIRQHQFEKVELVWIVEPKFSYQALEELVYHAEIILQKLQLPYRIMSLSSADVGFSSAKTYDLEVWLPGQKKYREISSCSNCEDFQARRMKARYRNREGDIKLVHTLNGSGLAVGRTLIALLENYQQSNGKILIPEVLQPYMKGLKDFSI